MKLRRKSRWKRWGNLIVAVLLGLIIIYDAIPQMKERELYGFIWCFVGCSVLVKGLWFAFSKKGYRESERNEICKKRVYRYFFRKMAPVMEWAGYILFVLGLFFAVALPPSLEWFAIVLILAALIYILVMYYIVIVEIKSDREKNGQD